jgi:hypothetical protein
LLPDARDGPWHGPGLTGQVDAGSAPGCVFLATVGLHAHPTCEVTDTQQQHAATLPIICHSLTQSGGKADERLTKITQVKRAVPDRGGSRPPLRAGGGNIIQMEKLGSAVDPNRR